MSEQEIPEAFWDRADEIIRLANQQVETSSIGKVSASLLYAAARFNSFTVASSAGSMEDMKGKKEEAIRYFTDQFRNMLEENLDDYLENFHSYVSASDVAEKKEFVIDGNHFNTLQEFYRAIGACLVENDDWGMNWNALKGILRGGFGKTEYEEPFRLIWLNAKRSEVLMKNFGSIIELIEEHDHIELIQK